MTLEEKLAQIVGFWEKGDGEVVAPLQGEFTREQTSRRVHAARARAPDPRVRHPPGRRGRAGAVAVGPPAPAGARDPAGHPGDRARGVPDRAVGVAAATFPTPLAWGASFDPDLVERDGCGDRRVDARARHPPGPRARARRHPRPSVGPGRRVHRRGPVPRRHDRHVVRARPAVARACTRRSSTSSATRAPQSGRNFAPVHAGPREVDDVLLVPFEMAILDGGARSVMQLVQRDRRRPGGGRPAPADRRPARPVGLRRHRRRRLLRRRVPAPPARGGRRPRRGRRAQALAAGRGRRAADRRRLPGPARRGGPCRARRRGAGRPGRPAGAAAEARARAARRDVRRRAADRRSTSTARAPRAGRAGWPRSRSCCCPTTARCRWRPRRRDRGHRPERRPRRGAVRLLLVPQPRARAPPRGRGRVREPDGPAGARGRAPRRRDRLGARLRGRRRRPVRLRRGRRARRRPPRWPCSSSATTPGCSAGGPWARAATATTSSCPACSASWSRPCWHSGTPVVLVLLTGRPVRDRLGAGRAARPWCRRSSRARRAAPRVAGVLSGRVNPSGHLPVSLPRSAGAQPYTYLHPPLGGNGDVTNLREHPGAPVRARAVVHDVRAQRPRGGCAGAHRRAHRGERPRHQHGGPARRRRRAALRARRRRLGDPAGGAARRVPAGPPRARRVRTGDLLGADDPAGVLRPRPRRGWSSRARSSSGWARPAPSARPRRARRSPARSTRSAWTARAGPRCRSPTEQSRGRRPRAAARRRPRCTR